MQRPFSGVVALLVVSCLSPAFSQRVIANIAVGNQPIYLAVDQKTNRVYVSNQGDDTVSVIDGATNTVIGTVKVGHDPNGVAVNPRTNTIYVANLTSGSLSIIDGADLTTSTLKMGSYPAKVAVNPTTNRVYVTLEDRNGYLKVINGKERKVIASIPLPSYPLSVSVDTESNRIYVADFLCGCGQISVIDGATNAVTDTIDVTGASLVEGVALDWKHDRAYATDEKKGLYIIDPISGAILGKVSHLHDPNEVAAIPGTTYAVEPDTGSNRAVFIDASTFAVQKRVRVGMFPTGVAVNATTKRVYVANRQSNTVSVIQLPRAW
ncbi:MAG TPA: YncE family protein [Terriglobales bacterium]|nr:YncE family protein [Terriglobales bacterium]